MSPTPLELPHGETEIYLTSTCVSLTDLYDYASTYTLTPMCWFEFCCYPLLPREGSKHTRTRIYTPGLRLAPRKEQLYPTGTNKFHHDLSLADSYCPHCISGTSLVMCTTCLKKCIFYFWYFVISKSRVENQRTCNFNFADLNKEKLLAEE